ncbi:hypothetical protein L7F22_004282 [Adiantum nelumboides]|nr:hypothetical protein [Adiantum nelumboides]
MTVEARYYHGVAPWYNTPCGLISQLVWKDEFNAFMSKEGAKLDALGLNDGEKKKQIDKATKVEEERLKDRVYEYLSIANPLNDDEFFKLLYGIKWDDPGMLKITRDNLYCLTSSKITLERLQVKGPPLSNSFDVFYKLNLKNHILQAFLHFMDTVKSSDTSKKMPELVFSVKRVIYRWIVQCAEEHHLDVAPLFTKEWTNVHDENTMYSTCFLENKVTVWEANNCPWWLVYPLGIIPKQEIELRERFKKDSEEYIEETQKDALSPLSHGATQLTIQCSSQAIPLNKDKGHMEPPSTSRIPTSSSMPATTLSMAPSTSYMPATTPPMAPASSSMVATTSSLVHTTSFVTESLLRRELWERRPITRSVGSQYQTIVDVLLVDISQIDKFALTIINNFFATQKTNAYNRDGVPCCKVARLIFANFRTGLLMDGLGLAPFEGMGFPKWNTFSRGLVTGCMDLAHEFLADEGFLVTMGVAKHIGDFIAEASRVLSVMVELVQEAAVAIVVAMALRSTRVVLAALDDFNAFMSKESAKLDALGLNDVEKKKRLDKATKMKEDHLKDRVYKYLSIANPLNDDEFFKLLYGITWDDPGMLKAFLHLMDTVKSSDTSEKMPELVFLAKRVIYSVRQGEAITLKVDDADQFAGPEELNDQYCGPLNKQPREAFQSMVDVKKGIVQIFEILQKTNHESNMQIVSKKRIEDNFHARKFRITNYLKGKGYWDYVEGANEAPLVIPDTEASAEHVKSLKD